MRPSSTQHPDNRQVVLVGYRVADIKANVGATRERLVCCELCLQVLKEVLEYDLVVTPQVF